MKHPPIEDPVLGTLSYNPVVNWYEAVCRPDGRTAELCLHLDDDGTLASTLRRAHALYADAARYLLGARKYAVEQLLTLKNERWLDEDEEPVTEAEFMERITLQSIVFDADGTVTFYHLDDDLFWGHSIEITMDAEDRYVRADIPG